MALGFSPQKCGGMARRQFSVFVSLLSLSPAGTALREEGHFVRWGRGTKKLLLLAAQLGTHFSSPFVGRGTCSDDVEGWRETRGDIVVVVVSRAERIIHGCVDLPHQLPKGDGEGTRTALLQLHFQRKLCNI